MKTIHFLELKEKDEIYSSLLEGLEGEFPSSEFHFEDIKLRNHISYSFFEERMVNLFRFIKENSYALLKDEKVEKIYEIIDILREEIKRYDVMWSEEAEERGLEDILELWLHTKYDIENMMEPIEGEYSYLVQMKEVMRIMNDSECSKANLFFRNHSTYVDIERIKGVDYNENRILPWKTSNFAIALYYYYIDQVIDVNNSKEITTLYGHKTKERLEEAYATVKNDWLRIDHKYFLKSCKGIYNFLPDGFKGKAMDDQKRLKKLKDRG